jgi:hypothetical protein
VDDGETELRQAKRRRTFALPVLAGSRQVSRVMRVWVLIAILLSVLSPGSLGSEPRFRGGSGGKVIEVTRLDDDPANPQPGMLRWALQQEGPRVVKFRVAGTIKLRDRVSIKRGRVTIDGSEAPGIGVTLRGGSLEFQGADDIVIRYIRVRLGDETTRRKNREQHLKRPRGSAGLDCLNFEHCRNVLVDHVSASWSCDEIISVVHCQNVLVQWCILSEPLGDPRLHPYGDNHAFCFNASASTLRVEHCLFAHYVMRGPQFEANDMRRGDRFTVRMEAVNNVMFDFQRSGSRYTTGVEDHKREAVAKRFEFQFLGNVYLSPKAERPAIEAVTKHGITDAVRLHAAGNVEMAAGGSARWAAVQTDQGESVAQATPGLSQAGAQVVEDVLQNAGCSLRRDAIDERVVSDVRRFRARPMIDSPREARMPGDLTRRLFQRRF